MKTIPLQKYTCTSFFLLFRYHIQLFKIITFHYVIFIGPNIHKLHFSETLVVHFFMVFLAVVGLDCKNLFQRK